MSARKGKPLNFTNVRNYVPADFRTARSGFLGHIDDLAELDFPFG